MMFEVGQFVFLENTRARGMGAHIGAVAKVTKSNHFHYGHESIRVEWVRDKLSNNQSNGGYYVSMFAPFYKKDEQLLFSFMY